MEDPKQRLTGDLSPFQLWKDTHGARRNASLPDLIAPSLNGCGFLRMLPTSPL